ncbi:MAG: rhomboid family intramembrane serine protease [Meiothermus sp.]|nr:rhomboid family intramembrane serine protease [Meiothermus sp.]
MVLPIGLETSLSRFPRVTFALMGLCVLVFVLQLLLAGASQQEIRRRYLDMFNYYTQHPGLKLPPEAEAFATRNLSPELKAWLERRPPAPEGDPTRQAILNLKARDFLEALNSRPEYRFGYRQDGPWINAVLSLFLHGGWIHLLGNLLLLYLLGIKLEDLWGGGVVLGLFLVGGAVASLSHGLFSGSGNPVIGASGAIAALMGAFLVRLHRIRVRMLGFFFVRVFVFTWPAWVVLVLWFLQQVLTIVNGTSGNIATWAHLGGFGFGVVAALALRLLPLEKGLLGEEQRPGEDKLLMQLEEGERWLGLGSPKPALQALKQYVAARPRDPAGWDAMARALRMDRQNPAEAATRAVVEWLEVGQTERALHLLDEFGVRLGVREAARVHQYLEPALAQKLLSQALMAHPDDPYAPKAALLLGQAYPGEDSLEVVQWVYEFTLDPDWAERLRMFLARQQGSGN